MLNLGCGPRFHKDWTNVDFTSFDSNVMQHNLLKGIPFSDNTFDAVYHSHVLEHFSKNDAEGFIKECFRVLKPGGIIRIVLPDLEEMAQCYLNELKKAEEGNIDSEANYDWIMLELYDQTIRNEGGGGMAKYLAQKEIKNDAFVFSRIGEGFRTYRTHLLNEQMKQPIRNVKKKKITISRILRKIKSKIPVIEYRIGNFRLSGEIHQWMYDRYSLRRLLEKIGFIEAEKMDPFKSNISNWGKYELDVKDTIIHGPVSLFMEAKKPF